ncbi:MAG: bacteriohemerythrin [Anaerolineales bacterium]|nr:bacteriohemerythrin [Anaerolineales bacterium]
MQWTIRLKILAGFGVVLALLVVQFIVTWVMATDSVAAITVARDQGYAGAMLVERIKYDVSQTWQWLSDVSATRSPDGYAEAERYAQDVHASLEALVALHSDDAAALNRLGPTFDQFYEQGQVMAQAYVDGGTEAGNVAMTAFDGYGEQMTAELEAVVTKIEADADQDLQSAIDRATQIRTLTGLITLVVIAGAVVVAVFIANQLSRPLQALRAAADGIAGGDLEQRLTIRSRDEIGQMAAAFQRMMTYLQGMAEAATRIAAGDLSQDVTPLSARDRLGVSFAEMTANLRQLLSQVSRDAAAVGSASDHLAAASSQAGQATQQVTVTMQQVARGASQQSEGVTTTAASMEQMRRAIDGVARGAQEQARAVSETTIAMNQLAEAVASIGRGARTQTDGLERAAGAQATLARSLVTVNQAARSMAAGVQGSARSAAHGAQLSEDSTAGMGRVRQATEQLAARVRDLGKRTGQIGAIVETIEDIAAQTNLLALNAAIEAARAGQHGKGFAVVADEVRKLAERSAQATKEIATMIGMVQTGAGEVVEAMQAAGADVGAAAGATEAAGSAFQSIAGEVKQLLGQVQAIESVMAEMDSASRDLEAAVAAAGATARENQAAAQAIAGLNDRVVTSLDSVSAVVEENTAATEQMAAGASEITHSVENIASISEENSAATEQVSAATEQMSAQVAEVGQSAQALAELAQALQAAVGQFRLAAGSEPEIQAVPAAVVAKPAAAVLAGPARPANGHGAVNGHNAANGHRAQPRPVNGRSHGPAGQRERAGANATLTNAAAGRVFEWSEALATGDAKVDQQHQELFRQINALLQAMAQGRGRAEVEPILDFLSAYVDQHFTWEESCMEKHRCPMAAVNQQAHGRFVTKFQALRDRFNREGPSADLLLAVKEELGDWLVNHIRKIDTSLKPCVSQHQQSRK